MAITDPTDISGLRAWWAIDQDAYSDAGSTAATDGVGVQQWNDQSGNGHNASQATSGDRPKLIKDITTGTAADGLRFDSADSFMTAPAAVATPAITEGAIFMRAVLMGTGGIILSGNKSGSNTGDWQVNVTDYGDLRLWYNNGAAQLATSGNAVPHGVWTTIVIRLTATGVEIWIDGAQATSNSTPASLGGNSQDVYIGEQTAGGERSYMVMGEMGFYDAAITDTNISDLHDYLAARFVSPSFTLDGTSDANVGAAQGVATDGTNWWASGNSTGATDWDYIYKYTKSGDTYTLVSTTDASANWRTGCTQVNGLHYADGYLYAACMNYSSTPGVNCILIYDASDMSFVDRFDWDNDWTEGGSFGPNGNFFACYDDEYRFDEFTATDFTDADDWSLDSQYTVIVPSPGASHRYQSAVWVGDLMLANWHEGITPPLCDVFKWTGAALYLVYRLSPPNNNCTQGIHRDPTDPDKLYWAQRYHPVGSGTQDHRIVESTISDFVGQDEPDPPDPPSGRVPRSGVAIANGVMMV